MSLFPSVPDVFVNKTGADSIASSDPNAAYDAIENIENYLGASGEVQAKSVTMINMFRSMFKPLPACSYVNATSVSVEASEMALFNGTGDDVVFKRNAAAATCSLAIGLLDGSEEATTWYNLYAIGDGANSAFTLGFLGQGTDPALHATYYKLLFPVLNDSNSDIFPFFQRDKLVMWDVPVIITTTISSESWSGAIDCSAMMPAVSRGAIFGCYSQDAGSGLSSMTLKPNGSTWAHEASSRAVYVYVNATGISVGGIGGQSYCATDEAQKIQHYDKSGGGTLTIELALSGYVLDHLE